MLNLSRSGITNAGAVTIIILSFVFVSLGTGTAFAQGQADEGKDLAVRYCSRCHEVAADTPSKNHVEGASAFLSISNNPKKSSERHLIGVLGSSGPTMPGTYRAHHTGQYLSRDQVDSLITYIQQLKSNP